MVQILKHLPHATHAWIDERTGLLDDAAVVRPEGAARSLVLTMDVITPIVDDPHVFGVIAATNALSDVYAMGGRPELALSFLGIPTDSVSKECAAAILMGMHEACARARCAIVGGHTMVDTEPKCGLSVVGSVDPRAVWSQRFAQDGDALVLTKALGTGLVAQATRAGTAESAWLAAAVVRMTQLNDVACAVGLRFGVHACTDVTGFGLLGHLRNVVEASQLTATISSAQCPRLPGASVIAESGCVPGGTRKNLAYASLVSDFEDSVSEHERLVLADAQTSGGLLLVLPASSAEAMVAALRSEGVEDAQIIGAMTAGPARIRVIA
ncbi:MAG: selenide, water dikinase SelD [Myxococcales bacterium]|nr:selenide, water dikinase SelD [Myxococcales bacterium]